MYKMNNPSEQINPQRTWSHQIKQEIDLYTLWPLRRSLIVPYKLIIMQGKRYAYEIGIFKKNKWKFMSINKWKCLLEGGNQSMNLSDKGFECCHESNGTRQEEGSKDVRKICKEENKIVETWY